MDHHRLLSVLRSAQQTFVQTRSTLDNGGKWEWAVTPILFPQSKCPYCTGTIQSPYIWLLAGQKLEVIRGAFKPVPGGKLHVVQPSHPHGAQPMCLGRHIDGVSLLMSAANLNDCGMSKTSIPLWYKRYWEHSCSAAVSILKGYADAGYPEYLREYERLKL